MSASATLDESNLFLNTILNPLKLSANFKFYFNCSRKGDVTLVWTRHTMPRNSDQHFIRLQD